MEPGETKPSDAEMRDFDQHIQIWSKVIDTQMHFNEMCVKSRQLGLTFATAALGFGIVSLNQGGSPIIIINSFNIHIAELLILGAALAVCVVMQLDLQVYHKMLRGAVSFNEDFEERYIRGKLDMEMGLTQAISHFGRRKDAKFDIKSKSDKYKGSIKTSSEERIRFFYQCTIGVLFTIAFLISLNNNPKLSGWMIAFGLGAMIIFILWKTLSKVRDRNSPNEEQRE